MRINSLAYCRAALAVAGCLIVSGCTRSSTTHSQTHPDMAMSHPVDLGGGSTQIWDPCVPSPLPGINPTTSGLATCCTTGAAHCVPQGQVLATLAAELTPCTGGSGGATLCMPDEIISAGGQYQPPACTSSFNHSAGVCLSQCIPLVANNPDSALLNQDSCGAGDLCVPCTNPLNGQPTGACDLVQLLCTAPGDGGVTDGGQVACPYTGPPLIDPSTLPSCAPACNGAHCLPAALVPSGQASLLTSCTAAGGAAGLCAPDTLIETGGNFVPKSCTSVGGAEGRCTSICLPSVASEAVLLPQDVCDDDERCAPCFNPTASDPTAPTGACNLACDSPKQPPLILTCPWTGPAVVSPAPFPQCAPACAGSHCVPGSLVPASDQKLLATCDSGGGPGSGFCAPDQIIEAGGEFVPKTCVSIAGLEGRCLSTCLPPIAAEAALLPTAGCAPGEACAPCYDVTASAKTPPPTGACTLACDQPVSPAPAPLGCNYTGTPVVNPSPLPSCGSATCSNAHCLPADLVPTAQQALLAPCSGGGFCTPDQLIETDNHFIPKTCTSIDGVEGRCLSTCLPLVAGDAALLPSTGCAAGERCAPCYDITSSDAIPPATGACSLSCDKPVAGPPPKLTCPYSGPPLVNVANLTSCASATCSNAHCLPATLVPPDQQALLAPCAGGGFCTPDPIITSDNRWNPTKCTSIAGAEGRCLSTCLPSIENEAALLPTLGCAAGEVCAPCYDPTSADPTSPTGACSIGCDIPTKPPVILACPWEGSPVLDVSKLLPCDGGGCAGSHCLPKTLVPAAEADLLASCDNGQGSCTPDVIITSGTNYVPPTCNSIAGVEGRCLSTCLPPIKAESAVLPVDVCTGNTVCAPCYNPTATDFSAPTGACSLGCDKPAKAPVQLMCPYDDSQHSVIDPTQLGAACCSGAHCLPSAFVPAADASQLGTCNGGAGYCTPDDIIKTGGNFIPPSCNVFGQSAIEGRWLVDLLAANRPEGERLCSSSPTGARPASRARLVMIRSPEQRRARANCRAATAPRRRPTSFPAAASPTATPEAVACRPSRWAPSRRI